MPEILVIEDNPPTREIYAALLTGWGYRVRAAASTRQAVDLVRSGCRPDAIVTDYNLGWGDTGLAALQAIEQALGRSIPAVMISGETSLPDVGVTAFRKPISREQLRTAIAGLLREDVWSVCPKHRAS